MCLFQDDFLSTCIVFQFALRNISVFTRNREDERFLTQEKGAGYMKEIAHPTQEHHQSSRDHRHHGRGGLKCRRPES